MTRREGSIYDLAVLKLLHEHGAITLQALTHYLRGRHGLDESHLLQCIRATRDEHGKRTCGLEGRGLLTRKPMGVNRGRASRRVLELTRAGYREVRIPVTPHPYGRGAYPLDYQVARSTTMLHYLARGCRIIRGPEVYRALHAQAVATILAGHDRDAKGQQLDRLKKAEGYDMRMEALLAPDGSVALVLPVYQTLSWRTVLDRLTKSRDDEGVLVDDPVKRSDLRQVAAVVPLWFVVLGAVPREVKAAERGVKEWATDLDYDLKTATLPDWMVTGFPTEGHRAALARPRKTPDAGAERKGSNEAAA